MGLGALEILAGLGLLLLALYHYLTSNFDFWKVRNVPGPRPIPIFGNFKDILLGKTHIASLLTRYYNDYKNESVFGIFIESTPVLIVKDPDLIQDVLIKDFNVFSDRGAFCPKNNSFNQNIINLEYERWKPLRNKLSPVFTSGKLKRMFYLMEECAQEFEKYVGKLVEMGKDVEFKELTSKFTTQFTGTCMFGLDMKALADEDSEFWKHGRDMFSNNTRNVIDNFIQDHVPSIYEILGPIFKSNLNGFFYKVMMNTIEDRKKNNVRRNDFLGILMDLQDQSEKIGDIEFDDKFLTGQAITLFEAGYINSSTTMTIIFYELALNQDIQSKLRHEIRTGLDKNNEKLTYDSVNKMTYLDKVLKEAMRKYPPGGNLRRRANSDYTFKKLNLTIPQCTKVFIPIWAMHRDPEFYPDPEKFDPSRFAEEEKIRRQPGTYLPFSAGPHNCFGPRFANNQVKLGIIAMISKFKLDVYGKTCISHQIQPRTIICRPNEGIYLKISKL